jgi:pSer/pThr/pTyr-binding forkhead associated (FHA) protein
VDPDPQVPCPTDEPARLYHLDFAENLIGRRSDRKDIHPEINLRDPGASHRHAKLLRQPDGSLLLLDVGSTNGTLLNGAAAPEGVPTPLKDGDEIVIGCWTRITLREVRR